MVKMVQFVANLEKTFVVCIFIICLILVCQLNLDCIILFNMWQKCVADCVISALDLYAVDLGLIHRLNT